MMLERQHEIAKAKAEGKYGGRKPTVRARVAEIATPEADEAHPVEIPRRLGIGRASVYRVLAAYGSLRQFCRAVGQGQTVFLVVNSL
jgi:DNA invertase Pin-like site-specific DNA recombinase